MKFMQGKDFKEFNPSFFCTITNVLRKLKNWEFHVAFNTF